MKPINKKTGKQMPKTKKMVIRRGDGTRIGTDEIMYWSNTLQTYVTIPQD